MNKVRISVVVPLYNEQEVIRETTSRLLDTMSVFEDDYEIILVNDGSKDETLTIAKELCARHKTLRLVSFSRNFGHQTAITAGMDRAEGDAVIVIDADLQDPPAVMLEMIKKWEEGYDVVYGRRVRRKGETFFKRVTAKVFYRFLRSLSEVDMPVDAGDFRLLDRKVITALQSLPEHNRYVRGLVSWVGFKQTYVDYVREERFAGETKYPLKKMIRFAADGVAAFSSKPLRLSTTIGILTALGGFAYIIAIIVYAAVGNPLAAWSIPLAVLIFLNGISMILLGIVGGYISRIYDEVKGRPLYIISEEEGFEPDD